MRAKLTLLVVSLFALVGFGGLAPAEAGHTAHAAQTPDALPPAAAPDGICSVQGTVDLTPGLSSTPAHDHYHFVSTTIACTSQDPLMNGTFDVTAEGDIDGVTATGEHGTDCAQGHNAGLGSLTVTKNGGPNDGISYFGGVEFNRRGTSVHAWGDLVGGLAGDGTAMDFHWDTQLDFAPDPATQLAACVPGSTTTVTDARLDGEALFWNNN